MAKHTPGPWTWWLMGDKRWVLATPDRGLLIILDAVRSGFNSASLRFAVRTDNMGGIMRKAEELLPDHPDARLIAAAPDLLAACSYPGTDPPDGRKFPEMLEQLANILSSDRIAAHFLTKPDHRNEWAKILRGKAEALRAAIAKAEGKQP